MKMKWSNLPTGVTLTVAVYDFDADPEQEITIFDNVMDENDETGVYYIDFGSQLDSYDIVRVLCNELNVSGWIKVSLGDQEISPYPKFECALPQDGDDDDQYIDNSEYNIAQMSIATTNLIGGTAVAETFVSGSRVSSSQSIEILNANSGTYRLKITLTKNGTTETYETADISHNASASTIRAAILQHPLCVPGDVQVKKVTDPAQLGLGTTAKYTINFRAEFGDVQLIEVLYDSTLLCDKSLLHPIASPPYAYPLPKQCEIVDSCQTGNKLSVPCDGTSEEIEPCCNASNIRASANKSIGFNIERDLFDPNYKVNNARATLRDIVLAKGYKPSDYTPYIRNVDDTLSEVGYDVPIENMQSIIIVANTINTIGYRREAIKHIKGHKEVLPSRNK